MTYRIDAVKKSPGDKVLERLARCTRAAALLLGFAAACVFTDEIFTSSGGGVDTRTVAVVCVIAWSVLSALVSPVVGPPLATLPACAPPAAQTAPAFRPAIVPAETCCQICGTAARERWVTCVRCETPHHAACWSFNGRCSVYGCCASESRVARAAEGGEAPAPGAAVVFTATNTTRAQARRRAAHSV